MKTARRRVKPAASSVRSALGWFRSPCAPDAGGMLPIEALESRLLLAVAPVGPELGVNTFTTGDQSEAAAASDAAGNSIFVWSSIGQDGSGAGVYGQRYDAAGIRRGGEFRVNTTTAGDQRAPAVAADAFGNFVVTWESADQDGSGLGVFAQRYNAAGVPLGGEFTVNSFTAGDQRDPAVAMGAGGTFVITWVSAGQDGSGDGVYAQRFGASGAKLGGELAVNPKTVGNQNQPAVGMSSGGEFVVAWHDDAPPGGTHSVYMQRYDAAGAKLGGAARERVDQSVRVTIPSRPAVAVDPAGDIFVAWQTGYGISAQRFSAAAVRRGNEIRVDPTSTAAQRNPAVAADPSGAFLVAWDQTNVSQDGSGTAVMAQRYSAAGVEEGAEVLVNNGTSGDQRAPAVVIDVDGDAVVAWEGPDVSGAGVFAQRYEHFDDPATVGNFVWLDGDRDGVQDAGEAGLDHIVVRLYSVASGRMIASTVTATGGAYRFEGLRPGDSYFIEFVAPAGLFFSSKDQGADESRDSDVDPVTGRTAVFTPSANGVDYRFDAGLVGPASVSGVVFNDFDGNGVREVGEVGLAGWVIYADLDADGQKDVGEPQGTSGADGAYTVSGLGLGTYTLRDLGQDLWARSSPLSALTISLGPAQALAGVNVGEHSLVKPFYVELAGGETRVNPAAASGDQSAAAMDAAGNSVVVWRGPGAAAGSGFDIFAQRFDASGQPVGTPLAVNSFTPGDQSYPSVAMGPNGDFVVAWFTKDPVGGPDGVSAQRFDAAGVPQGLPLPVNGTTGIDLITTTIAMAASGDFAVGFTGRSAATGSDAYARLYDAAGAPKGEPALLNTTTAGDQYGPSVAFDAAGRLISTWASVNAAGTDTDVFAQRLDVTGAKIGGEFRVNEVTLGHQGGPRVGVDAAGRFVIAWSSVIAPPNVVAFSDVYARRYDASASPAGGEFLVNTYPNGDQGAVSVAVAAAGDFLVAYHGPSQTSVTTNGFDVFGQWFTAGGARIGTELRINTTVVGAQTAPSAAIDPDGNAVVVWQSASQGGVYAQRFDGYSDAASVGGRVWTDANGNSIRDPGEAPQLRGATLYKASGEQVGSIGAGPGGDYRFNGLRPGVAYFLEFGALSPAQTYAQPDLGGDDAIDSDVVDRATGRTATFTPAPDQVLLTVDAGVWPNASIGGVKFNDIDGDGVRDTGEGGLPGWTIFLDTNRNGLLDAQERSATTDAQGAFSFNNIEAMSSYRLAELAQATWTLTTPAALDVTPLPGQAASLNLGGKTSAPDSLVMRSGPLFHANTYTTDWQQRAAVAADADGDFVVVWQSKGQDAPATYGVYAQRYSAAGSPRGPELLVNTTTAGNQGNPAVAMDEDGDFVVVWESPGGIYGQRFSSAGDRASTQFIINTTTPTDLKDPSVAMDAAGDFVVVWRSGSASTPYATRGRRFNSSGVAQGNDFRVSTVAFPSEFFADVAMDAVGDFVVAWGSNTDIYAQRYSRSGAAVNSAFRVNTTTANGQDLPAVAMAPDGSFLVAWQSKNQEEDHNSYGVYAQRYNPAGVAQGAEFRVNQTYLGDQRRVSAGADAAGNFTISWEGSDVGVHAYFRRYNAGGLAQGGEVLASVPNITATFPDVAVAANGKLVLGWESDEGGNLGWGIYGRAFDSLAADSASNIIGRVWDDLDADGTRGLSEPGRSGVPVSLLDSTGSELLTAVTDSTGQYRFDGLRPGVPYVVSFSPPGGLVFTDSDRGGDDSRDSDADPSTGKSASFALPAATQISGIDAGLIAAASLAGTVFQDDDVDGVRDAGEAALAAWAVYIDLDANGAPAATEPSTQSDASGNFLFPNLRPGAYRLRVVTQPYWANSNVPAPIVVAAGQSVAGIRLGQTPLGTSLPVSEVGPLINLGPTGTDFRRSPAMAFLPGGGFVATWSAHTPDTILQNIHVQRFDASGNSVGPLLAANQTFNINRDFPDVAADSNGNFVVVWGANGSVVAGDSGTAGVYARRFNAAGVAQGNEFRINTFTTDGQDRPAIAMLPAGNFVVVWHSLVQDGGNSGVYARLYNASGTPQGAEFQVNTTTAGNQFLPDVAADAAGNFVVTWASQGQDGSGSGVYARRFNPTAVPLGDEFRVNTITSGNQGSPNVDTGAGSPAVDVAPTGEFAIAWYQSPTNPGVYVRRFDAAGVPFAPESKVLDGWLDVSVAIDSGGGFVVTAAQQARVFNPSGLPVGDWLFTPGPAMATDHQGHFVLGGDGVTLSRFERFADAPATLGGVIWTDANGNGIREDNELLAASSTVSLFNEFGVQQRYVQTDQNGTYRFTDVRPGTYSLVFESPGIDRMFTLQDRGSDDTRDSDADPVTGQTGAFSLAAGQTDLSRGAGYATPGAVYGVIFSDLDASGTRAASEPGIEGWPVLLDSDGDGQADPGEQTTFTDQQGTYSFSNVLPGAYRVVARPRPGWRQTAPVVSAEVQVSSRQSLNVNFGVHDEAPPIQVALSGSPFLISTDTPQDQNSPAVAMNSAGNFVVVWTGTAMRSYAQRLDSSGSPVGVAIPAGTPGFNQVSPRVALEADGDFALTWLGAGPNGWGVYLRRFDAQGVPGGIELKVSANEETDLGDPSVAVDGAGNSIVTWYFYDPVLKRNFIAYRRFDPQGAPLGVEVRLDANANTTSVAMDPDGDFVIAYKGGLQLFNAAGSPQGPPVVIPGDPVVAMNVDGSFTVAFTSFQGTPSSHPLYLQQFGATGRPQIGPYLASNSPEASAIVRPALAVRQDGSFALSWNNAATHVQVYDAAGVPQGLLFTLPNAFALQSPAIGATDNLLIQLWRNSNAGVYVQRYAVATQSAAVSGVVWSDPDADGIREPNEPGKASVIVTAYDALGHTIGAATTDSAGHYRIGGLVPGSQYQIGFAAPPDYQLSPADQGGSDAEDSDANPSTGRTPLFVAPPAGQDALFDAGLFALGTVSGTKFQDLNGDGVRADYEPGLPGWTVFIDDDADGKLDPGELSAVTDSNGSFTITQILPGVHRVTEITQLGWASNAPGYVSALVPSAQVVTGVDLGGRPVAAALWQVPDGGEFRVNTTTANSQTEPAVSSNAAGRMVSVWVSSDGLYGQRYDASGAPVGGEFRVSEVNPYARTSPDVAVAADGSFVVVNSYNGDVFARRFNAAAEPLGSEFIVNQRVDNNQNDPAVATDDAGNFLVAWTSFSFDGLPVALEDVYARRFDASGAPLGDEFIVNNDRPGVQHHADVAVNAAGGVLVVWKNAGGGGVITAQRYDSSGNRVGPEFTVSDSNARGNPVAALAPGGDSIIAWEGYEAPTGAPVIFARRFDRQGVPQSTPFVVARNGITGLLEPAVAIDATSNAVITWSRLSSGGTPQDVYGRRFNAAGLPQGPEFLVNTFGTVFNGPLTVQQTSDVAMTGDGKVLVVWQSSGQDGSGDGIYGQRYRVNPAPTAAVLPDARVDEDSGPTVVDLFSTFDDPDGTDAALSFAITGGTGLVSTATVDPATGQLTLSFAANAFGSAPVTVTATDTGGASTSATFLLTLRPVNDAPTLNPVADQTVERGTGPKLVTLSGISAGPGEADPVIVSVSADNPALFSELSITRATSTSPTATLTIAPRSDTDGSAMVTVTVTEQLPGGGTPLSFSRTFLVTVTPDVTAPTVAITPVSPDPRQGAVDAITFAFSEVVADFQASLVRNGSANLLTGAQPLATSDGGRTWTLSNLSPITFLAGAYSLTVSKAKDTAGNVAAGSAVESFANTQSSLPSTAGNDSWALSVIAGDLRAVITLSGAAQSVVYSAPLELLEGLVIDAGGGNDTLTINGFVPVPVQFQAGSGDDFLLVRGTPASDRFDLGAASVALAGAVTSFTDLERVRVQGLDGDDTITVRSAEGANYVNPAAPLATAPETPTTIKWELDGGAGYDSILMSDGKFNLGTAPPNAERLAVTNSFVTLPDSQARDELAVNSAGRVQLTPGAGKLMQLANLVMADDAVLDLADNALAVSVPAGGDRLALLASLTQRVRSARNPGGGVPMWAGKGITSTSAAADPAGVTGLAVVLNDRGDGTPLVGQLAGQPLGANLVLVKYAYNGDLNLDGRVNIDDFFSIDLAFANGVAGGWRTGDVDYSGGAPNGDDFYLMDKAFQAQGAPVSAAAPDLPVAAAVAPPIPIGQPGPLPSVWSTAPIVSDDGSFESLFPAPDDDLLA